MSQKTHNPHDKYHLAAMENIMVARDYLSRNLSKAILAMLDLDTLQLAPTVLMNRDHQSFLTDVLYQVELKNKKGQGYLFLLSEQQTSPEHWFTWRVFNYAFLIMHRHHLAYPDDKYLPLVLPIITYTGNRKWTVPRCLMDYIPADMRALWRDIFLGDLPMVELRNIPVTEILSGGASDLMMLMQKPQVRKHAQKHLQHIVQAIKNLEPMHQRDIELYRKYLVDFGHYLVQCTDREESQTIIDHIVSLVPEEVHMPYQTFADYYRNEGAQQGVQQGMQQGIELTLKVIGMSQKGMSALQIAKETSLSEDAVRKILAKLD